MLISLNRNFVWAVKFVSSISFIFEIAQNYTVIFFKIIRRKQSRKISQFFTSKHKINESNAEVSTHYWIVYLYSKNGWFYVFMSNELFNFLRNMFNTKTIKINSFIFYKLKQSIAYQHLHLHQGLLHMPHPLFRKNKVLLSYLFGFRNNFSTNLALINLTEMIKKCFLQWQLCLWCLHRPTESLWHCQSWYPSFQTKPLWHQRSSFWLVQKLYKWQNSVCNHQ